MMPRTLSAIAAAVDGELLGPDQRVGAVSTDTRKPLQGHLFVALCGEHFDGNEFIAKAARSGAAGALVSRPSAAPISQVAVGDTRTALGRMARRWRENFSVPMVAVTGSSGKTTVKALIGATLATRWQVCVTEGNLNNDIGVPLMLMRLGEADAAGVFELGANHAGEIDYLAGLVQPQVAVITHAGAAHLEGFGSVAGVAAAKGELLEHIVPGGTAILNADDPYFESWAARAAPARVLSFGFGAGADCSIDGEPVLGVDGTEFTLALPDGTSAPVALALPGRHNIANALAAAAACFALGWTAAEIAAGLALANPVGGRLAALAGLNGARLIDDCYNANPTSVRAALDYLADLPGKRVFVLGDMGELGQQTAAMHAEMGRYAEGRCDQLLTIGSLAGLAADAYAGAAVAQVDSAAAAAAMLRPALAPGVTVLIKASRAARLEALVDALRAPPETEADRC